MFIRSYPQFLFDEASDGTDGGTGGLGDGGDSGDAGGRGPTDYEAIMDKYPADDTPADNDDKNDNPDNVSNIADKQNKDDKDGDKTPTLEEELEKFNVEDTGDLLANVNNWGLQDKDGNPLEFKNAEEVKDLISKGLEGNQGTQELDSQRQAMEKEFSDKEEKFKADTETFEKQRGELGETLQEYQIFSRVLGQLQKSDPEVYNDLAEAFSRETDALVESQNNPLVTQLTTQVGELTKVIQDMKSGNEQTENTEIVKEWGTGLAEIQKAYGGKLSSLKVVPNYEDVKKMWASNADKSMTPKQAFFAVHGEQIKKALESKNKNANTKKQSDARLGKRHSNPGGGPPVAKQSREEYLLEVAGRHT